MGEQDSILPVEGVIPIDQMVGGDAEDTKLLKDMAHLARGYLLSFRWCNRVDEMYFGDGYGGIIAVFFARIEGAQADVDKWLWVIFGYDFPPACLVIDICKTPLRAFERYLDGLAEWIRLAKQNRSSRDGMPINVAATPENAADLERRLEFLRETVLPEFQKPRTEIA
jgi:hypothetical protein